jgi:hypothetical protein
VHLHLWERFPTAINPPRQMALVADTHGRRHTLHTFADATPPVAAEGRSHNDDSALHPWERFPTAINPSRQMTSSIVTEPVFR